MSRSAMEVMANLAWEWGARCFGLSHMLDPRVRALRMAEEVVEYCQAVDLPADQLRELIAMVYAKPKGDRLQELGGVAVTLAVACTGQGTSIETVFHSEVARCLSKTPESFAERNKAKIEAGMTGYGKKPATDWVGTTA